MVGQRTKMKTRKEPVLRLDFAAGATGTKDAVGKFATIAADGSTMSIVTLATTVPHGVILDVDGWDNVNGNGGTLALMSESGVVQVRLNSAPGNITWGSKLALCADGTVKLSTGSDVVVGRAWCKPANAKGGQLIDATLLNQ